MYHAKLKNEIVQSLEKGVGEHYFTCPYTVLTNTIISPDVMVVGVTVQAVGETPMFRRIPRNTDISFRSGFTSYLRSLLGDTAWKTGSFFHEGKTSVLVYKEGVKYSVDFLLARLYSFFPSPTDCTPDNPGKLLNQDEAEALFEQLRKEHCNADDWETLIAVAKAHGWYTVRKVGKQLLFLAYNV
ncbi:hypothetical protein [Escherichia coli]|uniref:hypothetical protein n=1 Tax=Escherichia coli TaxID=562 RepID=UPI000A0F56F1|nr:hypothetical protein [Escherichia coli]ORS91772.1 hypothetical protein BHS87_26135 [Escherichia coli]DAL75946.1 MAG TPA: hypothetical protein [Bacteriophage sp.]